MTKADFVYKGQFKEKERLILEQLTESTENLLTEINNPDGFSISSVAEQNHNISKYVKLLEKEFMIR